MYSFDFGDSLIRLIDVRECPVQHIHSVSEYIDYAFKFLLFIFKNFEHL